MADHSTLHISKGGGFTVTGADGFRMLQAQILAGSLKLYRDTGIIPTRGFGITKMLARAEQLLGVKYKRTQLTECAAHLETFAQTMRSAIEVTHD